jgi:hypothetical protein
MRKFKNISDILISPQPVTLRRSIPVRDIAFFILKGPGCDNNYIPFTNPGTPFHFAFDSSKTGYPI